MTGAELIKTEKECIMQTYGRYPAVMDHGKGACVYDKEGKKYIDFSSGIGVCSLGYGYEPWISAVSQQAGRLQHISNLYYTEPCIKVADVLTQRTGMKNVFFCNSGAEANEGMIKLARKYSFDKYGEGRSTIITLNKSFHGRTVTTLKATGQEQFHNYFFPFTEGFCYADAGDMESLNAAYGPDVCAVMIELIQGEGGVYTLDRDYVSELARFCSQRDVLLLIDEVQTGLGRTGSLFAFQQYGITPDIVSFAKGIAGGLPMGGFMAGAKCSETLTAGTHGSTFGGNPVCCAGALAVLETLTDGFLADVAHKGEYIKYTIDGWGLPCVCSVRGMGLMIGVQIKDAAPGDAVRAMADNGLLALTAGQDVIRLLPPLVINKTETDEGLSIMKAVLEGI